jgi:PTH1 family peptidyl-tRNA hydrolase
MPKTKLIVGLGNPGSRYDGTPHNIGFDVVDELVRRFAASPFAEKSRFKAATTSIRLEGGDKVDLMKPLTYMNLSGESMALWRQRNGIEPNEVLVIADDANLELGSIRLRPSGSDGGQKGLRDIIQRLASQQVPRLRLGIRPHDTKKIPNLSDYVLHKWWGVARDVAAESVLLGADCVEHLLKSDNMAKTMSLFNSQKIEVEPDK